MMLDIDVPALLVDLPEVTCTGVDADRMCAGTDGAFTGLELLPLVFGGETPDTVVEATARWTTTDPARPARGSVMLNRAGRLGVFAGVGTVLEPFGRGYAYTPLDSRWVSAWTHPDVTVTMTP